MCKPDTKVYIVEMLTGTRVVQSDDWNCIRELARIIGEGCRILKRQEDGTYQKVPLLSL